jgi:hypothetical protein
VSSTRQAIADVTQTRHDRRPASLGGLGIRFHTIKKGEAVNWDSYHANGPDKRRRKALPATCLVHKGPIGFANLLVSMQGRSVVFDPHVTSACLYVLDEEGATTLLDTLTEWLG